jgi:hypothetical protein
MRLLLQDGFNCEYHCILIGQLLVMLIMPVCLRVPEEDSIMATKEDVWLGNKVDRFNVMVAVDDEEK